MSAPTAEIPPGRGLAATVAEILGMIKFSHTLFALPFALFGAALAARGRDGWHGRARDWAGILICMAAARSAAMAFNRLLDRHIDARNPRTASRHLPSGRLSVMSVTVFAVASCACFIAGTLSFWPNRWPLILSGPVLLWLLGYSFAKRFTALAHLWLGVALGLAPLAAWIALRADIAWPPVLLGLAVIFWVTGFDVIYACQDADFDRDQGLHSIPASLGVARALKFAALCHAIMILALLALGWAYPLGWIYFAGVGVVASLLVYEHALVRADDLTRVNVAFFQVNIAISIGLLVIGLIDLTVVR
ncbi:UbiA-like polyprenyltransferase [Tundrisphaera sp. TA3]|uniref:UbiA-like polyprenyltransferase n=1 Tax=Tundrisphaera sp. TA3 TaxID=3435775 RepID=UPI003EBDC357